MLSLEGPTFEKKELSKKVLQLASLLSWAFDLCPKCGNK
jgi:hypothetical protein